MSRIIFQKSYITVFPSFGKTAAHKHPMMHLFFGKGECNVTVNDNQIQGSIILLDANVKHIVKEGNGCVFFLLIDPTSVMAKRLKDKYMQESSYVSISHNKMDVFANLLNQSDEEIIQAVEKLLSSLGVTTKEMASKDERIEQVIANIISGEWLNYSVMKIAKEVFLSESRLAHLFKHEAGISLKSYILLRKLEYAYKFVSAGGKITQAAQEGGFSSSAHLAYTCKMLTGVSITDVLRNKEK